MNLEKGKLIPIGELNYMILSICEYGGVKYAFANKVQNNEPTEEYIIIYEENNQVKALADQDMANTLIPIFQKKVKEEMENNGIK